MPSLKRMKLCILKCQWVSKNIIRAEMWKFYIWNRHSMVSKKVRNPSGIMLRRNLWQVSSNQHSSHVFWSAKESFAWYMWMICYFGQLMRHTSWIWLSNWGKMVWNWRKKAMQLDSLVWSWNAKKKEEGRRIQMMQVGLIDCVLEALGLDSSSTGRATAAEKWPLIKDFQWTFTWWVIQLCKCSWNAPVLGRT